MRIDRSGVPFLVAALVPALGFLSLRRPAVAVPLGVLGAFFAFFFRDPDRQPPEGQDLVLSPADGRVMVAGQALAGDAPPGRWLQVSLFLSPLDVHVNRAPVSGRVTRVDYRAGTFLPAYRDAAGRTNERTEVWIDREPDTIVFRQVVGVLARRIVCRLQPGDRVTAGERFGIMKFGSRMDVFLPPHASLRVVVGDRARAGETVLATLEPNAAPLG